MSSDVVITQLQVSWGYPEKMFRYDIAFYLISCYLVLSATQEHPSVHIFNVSARERANPMDYDYPESNLWLITKDDPIPVKLNGQWPVEGALETGQLANSGRSAYRARFSAIDRSDNSDAVQQSAVPISQDPVIYYDQSVTSGNRPFEGVLSKPGDQRPESLLVQLPVEITEGLWERPQFQTLPQGQRYVNARQNTPGENVNIKYDEITGDDQRRDSSAVFVPVRELTTRLPNSETFADSELTVPSQPYELPVLSSSALREGVGRFRNSESYPEPIRQGISFVTLEERLPLSENSTAKYIDETSSSPTFEREQEYGHVLTAEDIELLERLGILSSFVLGPAALENASIESVVGDNLQREYESHPVLIDNGGQNYLVNTGNNNTNFNDVVLIDVPHFPTAEYHSNIPENIGIHYGNSRIAPYVLSQTSDGSRENISRGNVQLQNDTYINGNEVLEILEFLNLNAGSFFNISSPSSFITGTTVSGNTKRTENGSEHLSSETKEKPYTSASINVTDNKQSAAATLSTDVVSFMGLNNETRSSNSFEASQPSISNGRIQPRLLETLPLKENEIFSRLLGNAIPISEKKIDLLKKLQIPPQPYFFGYRQKDGNGALQHRNEKSDSMGVVKGTYGYRDATGVYRNVSYIADNNGFHAVVKTNEPGTVSHNTADAVFMAETPPLAALMQMMAYKKLKSSSVVAEKP